MCEEAWVSSYYDYALYFGSGVRCTHTSVSVLTGKELVDSVASNRLE